MKKEVIKKLLIDSDQKDVDIYIAYLEQVRDQKNSKKERVNTWFDYKKDEWLANRFKQVEKEGLKFDGKHITLLSRGISYDYKAYKNKMLLAYPETIIDVQLVYKGDTFNFIKNNGKISYSHKIANPFNQKDDDVVGGYCVIKNKRGEFLTTLSPEDIQKHRNVARSDKFWRAWFKEMCLKTIIKKGCSVHFDDIFTEMNEEENKDIDLDQPVNIELKWKQEIEEIKSLDELRNYYLENKGRGKEFDKLVAIKKNLLLSNEMKNENS